MALFADSPSLPPLRRWSTTVALALDTSRRAEIDERQRQEFGQALRTAALWTLIGTMGAVLWFAFELFRPHFFTFFWAIFFGVALNTPRKLLLQFFGWADPVFRPYRGRFVRVTACVLGVLLLAGYFSRWWMLMALSFACTVAALLAMPRRPLVALLLVFGLVALLAVLAWFIVTAAVHESAHVTRKCMALFQAHKHVLEGLEDLEHHPAYLWLVERVNETFAYDMSDIDVPALQARLASALHAATEHATAVVKTASKQAVGAAGHAASLLSSFVIFFTTLISILSAPNAESFASAWETMAPLPREDAAFVLSSVRRNIIKILASFIIIFFAQGTLSYVCLRMVHFELPALSAALCGFLAMLPVTSPLLVSVPIALLYFAQGRYAAALLVLAVHVGFKVAILPRIYSRFQKKVKTTLISLSVVLGVARWGVSGAIIGPLVVGLAQTTLDVAFAYLSRRRLVESEGGAAPVVGADKKDK